jgi:hypothetical protein
LHTGRRLKKHLECVGLFNFYIKILDFLGD